MAIVFSGNSDNMEDNELTKIIDNDIRQSEFTYIRKLRNEYWINEIREISDTDEVPTPEFANIKFQNKPTTEGVNGIFLGDLITICIDRLQEFQSGDLACKENAMVITKLEESLLWLHKRYMSRRCRGVLGTDQK